MAPRASSQDGYELLPSGKVDEELGTVNDDCGDKPDSDASYGRLPPQIQSRAHVSRWWIALALVAAAALGGGAVPAAAWTYSRWWSGAGLERERLYRSDLCEDAYSVPGYIWRGKTPSEIRWIPYGPPDPAGGASEHLREPARLGNEIALPEKVLARAPPSFNELLEQSTNLTSDPTLDFMRGKTVILVGDSHDRKNVEGFCKHHERVGAKLVSTGGHVITRCEVPDLDLKLVNWFHYGLAEENETWYGESLSPQMDPPPYSIEDRLRETFLPNLLELGIERPDLLIFNSVYWDLRYMARKAQHEGWSADLRRDDRQLSWRELEWHRSRLAQFVQLYRQQFPGVPMMYRLAQLRASNKKSANIPVFQINESAKSVMQELGVPIFPWGPLLIGEEEYVDEQHFDIVSQATYLHGDMLLYYLRRAVDGNWRLRDSRGRCRGRSG